jgi:hypothetical protein
MSKVDWMQSKRFWSKVERIARGEKQGSSKLTEAAVREIRASNETLRVLSERYGVAWSVIGAAKRRETWRHVT